MLGNFKFLNSTALYFGERSLESLKEELGHYGNTVQLIYGGGSIKKNGIYDAVISILKECGKTVVEDGGVMSNPTTDKLREGVQIARDHQVDFLLAVGGGSVCDYAKAVSVSVHCPEDPWEKYYLRFEEPDCAVVPVGCVLTMVGTGSEMNAGSVITDPKTGLKIGHVFSEAVMPKFAILNPIYTYSLPFYQMTAGIFDIFSHICEQYFSGEDDNTSDYISEGLMRSLVHSSRVAIKDPENYEARSNIMWTATWALNSLIGKGKKQDWMVHMMGQSVGGVTNATHGMNTSDYISEGLMRSLVHSSRVAIKDPENYEARSNIMWTATWALNSLIGKGKKQDWMVHMMGQSVGGVTNATHGMTLAAVTLPYYRYILKDGLAKFERFAKAVWDIVPDGKSSEEIAEEGLAAMEEWMKELHLVLKLEDLGVTEDNIEQIADGTFLLKNGYRELNRDEVIAILRAEM